MEKIINGLMNKVQSTAKLIKKIIIIRVCDAGDKQIRRLDK